MRRSESTESFSGADFDVMACSTTSVSERRYNESVQRYNDGYNFAVGVMTAVIPRLLIILGVGYVVKSTVRWVWKKLKFIVGKTS